MTTTQTINDVLTEGEAAVVAEALSAYVEEDRKRFNNGGTSGNGTTAEHLLLQMGVEPVVRSSPLQWSQPGGDILKARDWYGQNEVGSVHIHQAGDGTYRLVIITGSQAGEISPPLGQGPDWRSLDEAKWGAQIVLDKVHRTNLRRP